MSTAPATLLQRLNHHAAARPHQHAYRDAATGQTLCWIDLRDRMLGLSARARGRLPARSVVVVVCPNQLAFPALFLGLLHGGFSALLLSPESTDAEVQQVMHRASSAAIIASTEVLNRLPIDTVKWTIDEASTAGGEPSAASRHGQLLLLSSGSTGLSKIAVRNATSIDAVSEQMVNAIGFTETDQVLATVPLCHSYGIEHGLLAPVYAGATTHLCPGLEWPTLLRELDERHVTVLPGVPPLFEMLSTLSGGAEALPSLRAAYSAGGPLPRAVADRFQSRFGAAVGQLYGATEIGSITYCDASAPGFSPASVGRPMDGVAIRIDTARGGEIMVKARSMFDGYLDAPASPLVDGFYPTGDVGEFDAAGNLCITGRLKLLLEIGGQKVNPLEVEAVLLLHPAVAEAVVVPVRQSETILRLKAIVVARDAGHPPELAELRAFARGRLASYKVPRLFEVRDTLPHTPAGKIQRQQVQP